MADFYVKLPKSFQIKYLLSDGWHECVPQSFTVEGRHLKTRDLTLGEIEGLYEDLIQEHFEANTSPATDDENQAEFTEWVMRHQAQEPDQ
jgi:hypothetical protein